MFAQVLKSLNENANLLLVIITTVYVWLTWRTLKALQRASLRDRELRHLEDIKQHVVRPLIQWLNDEAVARLKGTNLFVQVRTVQVLRPNAAFGEPLYDFPRKLEHTLSEPRAISHDLLRHSKELHFAQELGKFEEFLTAMRKLADDSATFARKCADLVAASTSIRRDAVAGKPSEQAVDSDYFVEVCLRDLLLGKPIPKVSITPSSDGTVGVEVYDAYVHRLLGKGPRELLTAWVKGGADLLREQWKGSGTPERIERLLGRATGVRQTLEGLEFTYYLPGDCEYVGGTRLGVWNRVRRRFKRSSHFGHSQRESSAVDRDG